MLNFNLYSNAHKIFPFVIPGLCIFTATHFILPAFSNIFAFWYALDMFAFLTFFWLL